MAYTPHTQTQKQEMLESLGLERLEQLFDRLPPAVRLDRPLAIAPGLSEMELRRHFARLAARNRPVTEQACFLGAGLYDHYVPSVVGTVLGRGEFYTAYTPYQPEMSQGTLQAIFEFQTMVCQLTGMDVANASMYDGASALAEAVIMACDITGRDEAVLPPGIHPAWRQVTQTYVDGLGIRLRSLELDRGFTAPGAVRDAIGGETACVVVQQPNFFGSVEPLRQLGEVAKAVGALLVVGANPVALGLLETPGAQGADIVVAEGQPLGLGLNFGGPLVGLFGARAEHVRKMPGRLVGESRDHEGRQGYVLTLQTREQHIRRERATSNICTNQGLCMLAATTYLSVMGRQGLRDVARQCLQKSHYAQERITALPGYAPAFSAPFFHEFAVRCPRPALEIAADLAERGILAGYPLGRDYPPLEDCLLVAVTEQRTREEIDRLVEALK
jgi:glycine dehydrogenase subunit 1